MPGHVILSHGLESGPDASKVSALAAVAEELGWTSTRPDYRDLDAALGLGSVTQRVDRLLGAARGAAKPLVLAGSSLGAFASGWASLQVECAGLFLMAPPLRLSEPSQTFACAEVPITIVHGWNDELIPARYVIDFAQARRAELLLVDDNHRLTAHLEDVAQAFRRFLLRFD